MTTTDLWIQDAAGKTVAAYHGGLGGPAFEIFDRLRDLAKAGEIAAEWSVSGAHWQVPGHVLLSVLQSFHHLEASADAGQVAAIQPEAVYSVGYVEF
jgi:hypothetical protein